jgi:UDP-glucose 4-epimerase
LGKNNQEKEKVLITGGAGYIGSHIVKIFGEKGLHPVTIDNLSTGNRECVLYGDFHQGDIRDQSFLQEVFDRHQFSGVIHVAGSIVVPESWDSPLDYYENNTAAGLALLKTAIQHGVPHFLFSSTAAVYGTPKTELVAENAPLAPLNPYGRSKLMFEMMIEDMVKSTNPVDMNALVLRYFNVAGADPEGKIGQCFPNATHLIRVCAEAATGTRDSVTIFGTEFETPDGTGVRDYIHVSDLAAAHYAGYIYLKKNNPSTTLNCGYGKGYSVKEVIDCVQRISQTEFPVKIAPPRPGDAASVVADNSKIKKVLDWSPQYQNIEFIVDTALNWERKWGKQKENS